MSKELRAKLFHEIKLNPIKEIPDYGNDPEIQRLTEEARQFLKEHPMIFWIEYLGKI